MASKREQVKVTRHQGAGMRGEGCAQDGKVVRVSTGVRLHHHGQDDLAAGSQEARDGTHLGT